MQNSRLLPEHTFWCCSNMISLSRQDCCSRTQCGGERREKVCVACFHQDRYWLRKSDSCMTKTTGASIITGMMFYKTRLEHLVLRCNFSRMAAIRVPCLALKTASTVCLICVLQLCQDWSEHALWMCRSWSYRESCDADCRQDSNLCCINRIALLQNNLIFLDVRSNLSNVLANLCGSLHCINTLALSKLHLVWETLRLNM